MAWTMPRTWVHGEVPTATQFNTHIRDNFLELGPAKVAEAGDFIVGGVGGLTLRRIPIGAPVGAVLVRQTGTNAYRWVSQSVPPGMLIYFDGTACPSGWSEFTQARGRVIVGLQSGGTLRATVGTALTNLGTRSTSQVSSHYHGAGSLATSGVGGHTHDLWFGTSGGGGGVYAAGGPGGGSYGTFNAGTHGHSLTGTVAAAGSASVEITNPYIQFLVCQKD